MSADVTERVTHSKAPGGDEADGVAASPVLARRLAAGFAWVSLVALAMCIVLEALLGTVETSVAEMQAGEAAIRNGLDLAAAVREQYIHQAHVLVERSEHHMDHYPRWVEKVRTEATALRARLPASEHWRIDAVLSDSSKLDHLFRTSLLPAIHRADFEDVLRQHHGEAEHLSAEAVAHADALARSAEAGMADEHHHAIMASRLGLVTGAFGMLSVIALSVLYTRRLRSSLLTPLAALTEAANRFGRGEFGTRVGKIGEGELQAVADACDHMIQEIVTRERKLIEAERMAVVGQFAAGIAHELNNPIGVIRGYLKTMKPSQPPEMLKEELQILDEEAAACQRIAEDLLAFARPGEVSVSPIAIDEVLGSVVHRFLESGEAKGRTVSVALEPARVPADAGRMRQVMLNLLRNAVQASPAAGRIDVKGALSPDGALYEFSVLDRGSGVPDEQKARVFEPFFSTYDGGSGLGLAVCHGIVTAHGGSISLSDREGGGAAIRVVLPMAAVQAARGSS